MKQLKTIIIGLLILAITASAAARITIKVTRGIDSPTNIAVVPFLNSTGQQLPESLGEVIANDLQLSGRFKTLTRTAMPGLPSQQESIVMRDWRALNQDYIVIGRVESDNGRLRMTMELFDVFTGQRAMTPKSYYAQPSAMRAVAHRMSDEIYQQITGTRGIFSTKLAYVVKSQQGRRTEYRLEVADYDGANAVAAYRTPMPIISPSWSPDSKKIAFVTFDQNGRSRIDMLDLASGTVKNEISYPGINGAPSFSPDGSKLAFTNSQEGNPNIYVKDLRSGRVNRLTDHWAIDTEAAWSQNGRQIVFTSDRGGMPQLYMVRSTGGRAERITFEGNYNARAQYSADGQYIVYVHGRGGNNFNIAAMNMSSRQTRILTATTLDESPSLAPNGSMLVYGTKQQGKGVLAWVSVDGQVRSTMPVVDGDVREPAWSPYRGD